jgi:hypothetical protein
MWPYEKWRPLLQPGGIGDRLPFQVRRPSLGGTKLHHLRSLVTSFSLQNHIDEDDMPLIVREANSGCDHCDGNKTLSIFKYTRLLSAAHCEHERGLRVWTDRYIIKRPCAVLNAPARSALLVHSCPLFCIHNDVFSPGLCWPNFHG